MIKSLKSTYNKISNWENRTEISQHSEALIRSLSDALDAVQDQQKPFLIQPIWRTEGQSFVLSKNCFDVFVWSDVAVMKIPAVRSMQQGSNTRTLREVARHVRALYDLLNMKDYDYNDIYKGMELGNQTDKAFALSGKSSIKFLKHPRLNTPCLGREVLSEIILHGGENELRPERRFDAAVQTFMLPGS